MQSFVKHWLVQESVSFLRVETVEKPTTVYDNKTITDVVKLVCEGSCSQGSGRVFARNSTTWLLPSEMCGSGTATPAGAPL